jgi:hypothetical protein
LLGCASSGPLAAESTTAQTTASALVPLVSRTTPDGEVTAVWMGSDPGTGVGPDSPVGLWIREIHFHFDGGVPLRYPIGFEPDSATFEIFSPDGAYVALSQGRDASFHIVPVASLQPYLQKSPAPHEVVTGARGPGESGVYAHEPRWATDRIFEFETVSSGSHWHVTHLVGGTTEVGPVQDVRE